MPHDGAPRIFEAKQYLKMLLQRPVGLHVVFDVGHLPIDVLQTPDVHANGAVQTFGYVQLCIIPFDVQRVDPISLQLLAFVTLFGVPPVLLVQVPAEQLDPFGHCNEVLQQRPSTLPSTHDWLKV